MEGNRPPSDDEKKPEEPPKDDSKRLQRKRKIRKVIEYIQFTNLKFTLMALYLFQISNVTRSSSEPPEVSLDLILVYLYVCYNEMLFICL